MYSYWNLHKVFDETIIDGCSFRLRQIPDTRTTTV